MIDIDVFRDNPERVRESERRRGSDPSRVDEIVELDGLWRDKLQELEQKQQRRNEVGDEIAERKRNGEDAEQLIDEMQDLKQEIDTLEDRVDELKEQRDEERYRVGNLLHEDVPSGDGEEDNVQIRTWSPGDRREESELGADILDRYDLLSGQKAAEVSGERAYYLDPKLFKLNQALINFASDFISDRGFDVYQVPFMLEEEAISAAVDIEAFREQLYQVNENGRYLIATAEHSLAAKYMDTVIEEELPLRLGGFSTNFRREAGKHGKQTRGLWRVHQFEKVEQFVFCRPENHLNLLQETLENAEGIMKELELPYRVVDICDGDISDKTFRQYDIEVWRPPLGEYGEVGSYGSCTDYQSREYATKYFEDGERRTPYTVYATALASSRIITALFENHFEDGELYIPEALREYLGGRSVIAL
nr:MAG: seryl-tRNA synthetase [Candidatus Nanosalinarum sp. J07AB56]